jgi:lipid A ethanolaminephosphotransferase
MTLQRPTLRVEWLVALIALYAVAFGNGPWWKAVSVGRNVADPATWLFVAACALALIALHFVIFLLLSTRWTVKPLLTAVVIASAAAVYYMRTYSVLLDPTMLRNVVRTDTREANELITWSLVWNIVAWSLVPVAFIWWVRISRRPLLRAAGFRLAAIGVALLVAVASILLISRDLTSLMRNQRELRYLITPGNFIVSLLRNAVTDVQTAKVPKQIVGADARLKPQAAARSRPMVFVFMLGETARAANFSLLGYSRPTNPELAKLDIVTFSDVTACGTSTEVSVPCMFSPYGRADYDEKRIRSSEGLLNVLSRAGYAVKWIDNQSGCKDVCEGSDIEYRKLDAKFAPDLCDGEDCRDEILVRALQQQLAGITQSTVIVMHMLGNHGPAYYKRYPPAFRRFTPDCPTAELRNCSRDQVVNAFDNVILYTDHVLAETIRTLEAQSPRLDTAMLYVSDHGESLGESGLYLHGLPYAIAPRLQLHVPMISWMSASFATAAGVDAACLKGRAAETLSHDNLFHSLLGVLDVQTSAYRAERDLYAPCRKAPATQ